MFVFAVYPASKGCLEIYKHELSGIRKFLVSLFKATLQSGDSLRIVTDMHGIETLTDAGISADCFISGNLKDIWFRDWGVVNRVDSGKNVSFKYLPKSLSRKEAKSIQNSFLNWMKQSLSSDMAGNLVENMSSSNLIMDGGNVIVDIPSRRAVVTDRIFSDNKKLSKSEVTTQLSRDLGLPDPKNLCIIPEDPMEDVLGHVDGCAAFVTERDLVINAESQENKNYIEKVKSKLKKSFGEEVKIHYLPYVPEDKPYSSPGLDVTFESCKGVYVNLLRTDSSIYIPQYGAGYEQEDAIALKTVENIVKDEVRVVGVDCSGVAHMGGSVRCLTMNV